MELNADILARLEPIRGLSRRRLEELVALSRLEVHPVGSDPLAGRLGGMEFVYLLAGELKIVLLDGSMRLLVGGCDMANWPIGYKTVLPISSKAVTEVTLLRIEFDVLDIMMTWDELTVAAESEPAPDASREAPAWSTMTGAFSAQALTSSALAKLPPAHIHELLRRFERVPVARGEVIVREGDEGEDYFLVETGRCEVHKKVGGADICVAELKAGDAFGEEALVANARRNASIVMKTDGVLLRLAKPDFVELLQAPLLHAIERDEAERHVAAGACWLDVRYPAEFTEDGLPGAINLPLNEIRSAFDLLDPQREYIVYCQSGRRSSAGAFLLAQHGFKAYVLKDGIGVSEKA